MSNYKELKSAFYKEKRLLEKKKHENEILVNRMRKIDAIIDECVGSDEKDPKPEKVGELRRFFSDIGPKYGMVEKIINHSKNLSNSPFNRFEPGVLIKDLRECKKEYDYPTESMIEEVESGALVVERVKSMNFGSIPVGEEQRKELINKQASRIAHMSTIVENIYITLINQILDSVQDRTEKVDTESLIKEIDEIKEKIGLTKIFNDKFSNDELLEKFASSKELDLFTNLIKSFLESEKCEEILKDIATDQLKEKEETIIITFDDLDMSYFTSDEKSVIEEMHEILQNEDVDDETELLNTSNLSYSELIKLYANKPITSVLYDVKNNLINKIYDDKDEVISVLKVVVNLYKKFIIRVNREELVKELARERNDFNTIKSFINRTYMDKNKAFKEVVVIEEYINNIEHECIPMLTELINTEYDEDKYYDNMFETLIIKYRGIIKKYKNKMSAYNQNIPEEEVKENTENLVFCINSEMDLSKEEFQKEFTGAVYELESKTSIELKKTPGRKGMSRIKKSTSTKKKEDFIEFLENRDKIKLHFVPYRYSSGANYRTGLIKFEPSAIVKQYLEEKYGLSKQSAYYGIFQVIQVIRADHSEYQILSDYIISNYHEIEEIAKLFASPKPDLDKLTTIIDKYLSIKKDKLTISDNKGKSR